jgi:hypothetical protein
MEHGDSECILVVELLTHNALLHVLRLNPSYFHFSVSIDTLFSLLITTKC